MANLQRINMQILDVWKMTKGHFWSVSVTPFAFINSSLTTAKGNHIGSMIILLLAGGSTLIFETDLPHSFNPTILNTMDAYIVHPYLNFRDENTVTRDVISFFRNVSYTW